MEKVTQGLAWQLDVPKLVRDVIDAKYRGPVAVIFFNFSEKSIEIEKGNGFWQAGKNFANKYGPEYVPEGLPWYEKDRLITHIDQMKYKYFISDPDAHAKNTQIIDFEMIHAQCRSTPGTHSDKFYQTVREKVIKKKCRKKIRKKLLLPV